MNRSNTMKNTVVWMAEETAPFTGRWQAVGSTQCDSTVRDSYTYSSREECDRRVEVLNWVCPDDEEILPDSEQPDYLKNEHPFNKIRRARARS